MKNGNKPTNPCTIREIPKGSPLGGVDIDYHGLTKREYFAGLAMQGMLSQGWNSEVQSCAAIAVMLADALLKELDK